VKDYVAHSLRLLSQAVGAGIEIELREPNQVTLQVLGKEAARLRIERWEPGLEGAGDEPVLWVLKRASPADLERLREAGCSFVFLGGTVRIQAPGLLIDRADLPGWKEGGRQPSRSAFSDRASLVPRTLFGGGPEREWTISDLASAAGVSNSVASYALRDLEGRGLLEVQPSGRRRVVRLRSRLDLVQEWCREYRWRDNSVLTVLAPVGSPERFLGRLSASLASRRWAATLHAGSALLVRHAPLEEIHVYVDVESSAGLTELTRRVGWRTGEDGLLHLLVPRYRSSVWEGVTDRDGIPVVSLLQLILDLWHHPVRGREQAQRLLQNLELEGGHGS
jgi:hypothetical protein